MSHPTPIPALDAARLLLGAQGLLADPGRRATKAELTRTIERMGFVQVDTINVAGRAHDLTLFSRLEGYRPSQLASLVERDRALFEGWTHDASIIPTAWYPHWKPRFSRDRVRIESHAWWQNLLGPETERICAHVLERITAEGPLGSADFDHPEKRGPWWGWKPQKAALDYLWRTGRLAIAGRVNFHKRYDLAERVLPEAHLSPEPDPETHRQWVFSSSAERLVIFTPKELAAFWEALDLAEARAWCQEAASAGRVVPVRVARAEEGAEAQAAWAFPDWEDRLARLPEVPDTLRLLSPFDPVLRDRGRALARFGFDYRFEAFTPEAKRQYGYYVLPILEGDQLVGRLDPKLHRDRGLLEVRGLWWESRIKATKARMRRLEEALGRLAVFLGAAEIAGI
jgi:hypothetical protein